MEPACPWSGYGPTPTIVFAPGPRCAGDDCAPSCAVHLLDSADNPPANTNLNYEYPFYAMASAAGYRVVVTDTVASSMGGNVFSVALNGVLAHKPQIAPPSGKYFNDEGKAFLGETPTECTPTLPRTSATSTGPTRWGH